MLEQTPPSVFANLLARKFKGSLAGSENEEVKSLTSQLSKSLSADSHLVWRDDTRPPRTVSTTFGDLDRLLGSHLRPGAIYGIGGRPSMGKTAFALNTANSPE